MQNNNYLNVDESLDTFNVKNQAKIHVSVEYNYLESESHVGNYVFSYKIYLENVGEIAAQIIARQWILTDASDQVFEIKGLGIVGKQPVLDAGEKYDYSSNTSLSTPTGTMKGTYLCITRDGDLFTVNIPEFVLAPPCTLH
jgi:ApaG protein